MTFKELFSLLENNKEKMKPYIREFGKELEKIRVIDSREKRILKWYYGHSKTYEDIGEKLNITRERVKQLRFLTIKKLRQNNLI